MKLLSRVVWSEGMYLGPHHFQAQSRYFEDTLQFASSSLWFASFGLAGIELDSDALQNGIVSILHARGMFPDGLAFNFPESDALPETRAVAAHFPPTREGIVALLGIPPHKPNGVNCSLEENGSGGGRAPSAPNGSPRFAAETRVLHDENTGADERPVRLGRKNFRILFDTEPPGGLITLPLARILRDGSGHFIYDPNFVPPVLRISASLRLMLMVQRLTDILEEKAAALKGRSNGSAAFSTGEIANFWLLHSVNSALPPLRHLLLAKRGHPEELFHELSRLAGALCTFGLESNPRDLPLYNHDSPSDCFEQLDSHIRAHLETIVPTNCIRIPLAPAENYFFDGDVADTRALGRAGWVLAVRAGVGEAEVMAKAPQLIKVCSPPFVRELVKRALPGLTLTHLPVPPPAIAARVETQYFSISRNGPCWDHIAQIKRVGVYVPGEFPDPSVEIFAVLDT
jgi:type VI secretion system protein ImpJ